MLSMLVGVVASGRRSSEPEEVTYTVEVGTTTQINTTFRGGGTFTAVTSAVTIGDLTPSEFSRGYSVGGVAAERISSPKFPTGYGFSVELQGPDPAGQRLVATVQGLGSDITLDPSPDPAVFTEAWKWRALLPDDGLYANWAPGVVRTVTLRWEE